MKKKLLIGAICTLTLLMTGCGNVPKLSNGDEVIAEVKEKQFTANELYDELKSKYGSTLLVEMIDKYITNAEIEDSDTYKKQAEAELENLKEQLKQYDYNVNEYLNSYGFESEDDYINYMIYYIKRDKVGEKYIKENMITDTEIDNYYKNNIFGEITAKHILIAPDGISDEATSEEKAQVEQAALDKAKEIIEKLNNGEDFDTLAKEYSDDQGSKDNGGLIENFTKDSVVTEFWNAANNLTDGEYTKEPVKSSYGYHIILKVSQKEKPDLDTVREDVLNNIVSQKLAEDSKLKTSVWTKIREKYDLNIHDDKINSKYKDIIKE